MNKMHLVLGDWSGDGHGKSFNILLKSNSSVKEVQEAYKASCCLTGVSLHDVNGKDEDYTGKNRDYQDANKYAVAINYEDNFIPKECATVLTRFGFNPKDFKIDPKSDESGNLKIYEDSFVKLWIWFTKLSNPKLELELVTGEEQIPTINGFWDKNLNVQFGYGLYI